MKKLGLAAVAVMILTLIVVQGASAQDAWPGCPWGSAYDPMVNGYAPGCFTRPADTTYAAAKPAAQAESATTDWTDANAYYLPGYGPVATYPNTTTAAVAQNVPGCPMGSIYNPDMRSQECLLPPFATTSVAAPPAAVAQSVSIVCTDSGRDDTSMHGMVCYTTPAKVTQAAPKVAGLASINPVAKPAAATCPYGDNYDPLLLGAVEGCLNGPSVTAVQAAPKVAGLASINPVAKPAAATCPYGDNYDPLLLGAVEGCLNGPSVTMAQASPKVTGLANIEPVAAQKQKPECGPIGTLDLDPLAIPLACLSQ
jgi:hypothetical protein